MNDRHFIDYDHRISPANVDSIAIDGGVEIESVVINNPVSIWIGWLHVGYMYLDENMKDSKR